jgi:hypothetical protein
MAKLESGQICPKIQIEIVYLLILTISILGRRNCERAAKGSGHGGPDHVNVYTGTSDRSHTFTIRGSMACLANRSTCRYGIFPSHGL